MLVDSRRGLLVSGSLLVGAVVVGLLVFLPVTAPAVQAVDDAVWRFAGAVENGPTTAVAEVLSWLGANDKAAAFVREQASKARPFEELGREWNEGGKLLHKQNSFPDFIDCAEFMIAEGYADRSRVFARQQDACRRIGDVGEVA